MPDTTANPYTIEPVAGATSYTWPLSGGLSDLSTLVNGSTSNAINVGVTGRTVSVVASNGSCADLPLAKTVSLAPGVPAGIALAKSCINRDARDKITFSVVNPVGEQAYKWQPVYPSPAPGTAAPIWTVKTGAPANGPSIPFITNGSPGTPLDLNATVGTLSAPPPDHIEVVGSSLFDQLPEDIQNKIEHLGRRSNNQEEM